MKAKLLGMLGTWRNVADAANTTVSREPGTKEPSPAWKRKMLLCEHSPIRQLLFRTKWFELKSWVSVHFVRHKVGIEHWVQSQRTDRTDVDRDKQPQDSPVTHELLVNAQSLIYISRKRLCNRASPETREAWKALLSTIKEQQPELFQCCVPDCVYRGWCYELKSCGYHKTTEFLKNLKHYRDGINDTNE
jgi:hypothetical protein